jgi:dolichyl-phosphate-mannose--protein O-mannosyl transferase
MTATSSAPTPTPTPTPSPLPRARWRDALTAELRARWAEFRAQAPEVRATTIMLVVMVVGGVALRVWNIGAPPRFTFDEHHFIPNARHYLDGVADDNDHPPLGKLFIAASMLLFGDDPTGWRAASLILGLQTLVVAAALVREVTADRRAGWFAAAFFAADGFFLAYSRTALLDGGLACLVLWSILAALVARSWRGVLASAVLVGLAASVKWSGGFAVLPALAAAWMRRRVPRWQVLLVFGIAAPATHVGLWMASLAFTHRPASPHALVILMRDLVHRHVSMGHTQNPLASHWFSWPLLYHPIVTKLADYGTGRLYSSSAGNPLLFLSATAAVVLTLAGAGACVVRRRAREWIAARVPRDDARAALLLAGGWLALLAPWIVGRGAYTFMYHYLPSYGPALALAAAVAARVERRAPRAVAAYVGFALVLAIYFAPVWAEFPITVAAANRRLIFIPWQP